MDSTFVRISRGSNTVPALGDLDGGGLARRGDPLSGDGRPKILVVG